MCEYLWSFLGNLFRLECYEGIEFVRSEFYPQLLSFFLFDTQIQLLLEPQESYYFQVLVDHLYWRKMCLIACFLRTSLIV